MAEGKLSKLLTVEQLAEQLGIEKWTVRQLTKRGAPHVKLGNKFFFPEDAIAQWLADDAKANVEAAARRNAKGARSKKERAS